MVALFRLPDPALQRLACKIPKAFEKGSRSGDKLRLGKRADGTQAEGGPQAKRHPAARSGRRVPEKLPTRAKAAAPKLAGSVSRTLGDGNPQLALDQIEGRIDGLVHVVVLVSAQTSGEDHLALFGGKLSLLFLDSAERAAVRDQIGLLAQQFLVWNASCYFLLTLVNVLRFLIQGVGFTQQAVFAGVFETIARCFVGFAVVRWIGYTAICLANPAAWLLADCFLVPIYFHDMHILQRRFAQRRAEA